MNKLLELLDIFADSMIGGMLICIGVTGYSANSDSHIIKALCMLLVILAIVGIQCGAERRAEKKYKKKDVE